MTVVTARRVGAHLRAESKAAQENPRDIYGIGSFGPRWPRLDALTAGPQERALGVLGARPKVGKSMLCAAWIPWLAEQAMALGKVIRVVTLETSVKTYQKRMAAMLAEIEDPMRIRKGTLTPDEVQALYRAYDYLDALPIEYIGVDDDLDAEAAQKPGNSPVTIGDIDAFVGKPDTFWWVLDHIGLVATPELARGDYVASIYNLSTRLLYIAKRKVGGLVVTHLSRASGQALSIDAIAGSDQLGRVADQIFLLRRPWFELQRPLTDDEREQLDGMGGEIALLQTHSREESGGLDLLWWSRKHANFAELATRPGQSIPLPPTTTKRH